ncbi:MAG: transporter associated domain-containing protein [Saprospiraceae bacterium]
MFFLFLVLVLYVLVVYTERRLVQAGPVEWESFRHQENPAAQRVVRQMRDIRPALSALLLARILLITVCTVAAFTLLYTWPAFRTVLSDWSAHNGLSTLPGWILVGLLLAFGLGVLFWALQYPIWPKGRTENLEWVCTYVGLWQMLFFPFIPKSNSEQTDQLQQALLSDRNTQQNTEDAGTRDLALLKSIVKFSDVTVKQVMQPRSKVVAVDFRTHFHDLLKLVREAEFSRLPVYDEDLDNLIGILYVKDLLAYIDRENEFEWQGLIRHSVLQVPEAKHISDLLDEFKIEKLHMAIVVDEYGSTAGIVTMEDVLEEILGEIRDEFDEESEVRYRKLDDYTYVFEGQSLLNDVSRITGLSEETFEPIRGQADTLAGLVLQLRGDIPPSGEEVQWNGITLKVTAADNRRIKQLRLTLPST